MHTAQMPTGQSVPPLSSASSWELGDLLGATGSSVCWGRLFAFFIAQVIADLVSMAALPFIQPGSGTWPLAFWVSNFTNAMLGNVMLTAVALAAFRWIRNSLMAATVAAVAFTLVMSPLRLVPALITNYIVEGWRELVFYESNRLIWAALFLLGMAVAVRWMKPVWLALLVGAAAGSVLTTATLQAVNVAVGGLSEPSLGRTLGEAAYGLISALVFAAAFWGALQLPWARLREGPQIVSAHSFANYHRISKRFFVGSFAVAFGIALPLLISSTNFLGASGEGSLLLLLFYSIPLLYGAVVMMVLFYKMWVAIQDGHARATPGKAIGFLFIPILNIYWAFQFIWGWAKDYNSLVARHGLNAPRLPEKLFLTYVILAFTAWIPVLGTMIVSVNYFVGMAMVEHICNGINAIPPQLKRA